MKKFLGVGLLLLLIALSGCGSGNKLTPRITITGLLAQDSTGNTPINFPSGGTIEVTPLTPSIVGGAYQPATVASTFADLSTGQFMLTRIPTDRCFLLKITYKRSTEDLTPLTTFIKVNAIDQDDLHIVVTPEDWAAGRLTFDLLRSCLDVMMDHNAFAANYDVIFSEIKANCTSPAMVNWLADTRAFYSYLENIDITSIDATQGLSAMVESALVYPNDEDDDKQFTLNQYKSASAPGKWGSEFWLMKDKDYDTQIFDVGTINFVELYAARQIPPDETGTPTVHFRLVLNDSLSDPAAISIVFRDPVTLEPNLVRPFVVSPTSTSNRAYLAQVSEADLLPFKSENGYYLAQVISTAALNWPQSDYATIDLDRTPPFRFTFKN